MPGNAFGELVRVDSVGNLLLLLLLLLLFYLGGVGGREYVEVLRAVQHRGSSHRKVAFFFELARTFQLYHLEGVVLRSTIFAKFRDLLIQLRTDPDKLSIRFS